MAFNLADILSGLNPNIDSDLLKAARFLTKGERDLIKRLSKPSKAEKREEKRLSQVKSEEQLKSEIGSLFGETQRLGQEAIAGGEALGSALTQAIASAAGGLGGMAGGDNRVSQLIADAARSAQAPASEAGTAISSLGRAAVGSSSVQQAAAIANALTRRSDEVKSLEDRISELAGGREEALLAARAGRQGSFLQMLSTLLGFKPAGGYGGGRGGAASTTPPTAPVIKNIHGQTYFAGDVITPSGYFIQDTAGQSSGAPVIPSLQTSRPGSNVMPNVYRPGYGPSGSQGPRK